MSRARHSEGHLLRLATRLGDPERGLKAIAELRRRLDTWEAAHVDEAVNYGWSWQRVAESLGVTKQAAHARHAPRTRRSGDGLVVAGRARRAVQSARAEAARLGADSVETDHLLIGLLLDADSGPVKAALDDCGITCDGVRRLARSPSAPARGPGEQPPPVSPSAREALEQSMREAVKRGDSRLDVEHLLLAVLHEPGGRGQKAVMASGRSPGAVERRLSRALRDQGSAGSSGD
jgi:Clp amino terminal domain, pathogenicity island component